jgi:hypothetical protein
VPTTSRVCPLAVLRIRHLMVEDFIALTKARSMLLILLATCRETLTALDAAGNALDGEMTEDLRRMVARSEAELEAITAKLEAGRDP